MLDVDAVMDARPLSAPQHPANVMVRPACGEYLPARDHPALQLQELVDVHALILAKQVLGAQRPAAVCG